MQKIVSLAKVFSDINRLYIFALVLRDKEICVCEICDTLDLSQPLVSRHLRQMRETNILQAIQKGKWVVYSLAKDTDLALNCWIDEISKKLSKLPKLVTCKRQ